MRGPSQPSNLIREFTTNSMIAGAMLSEMSSKGILKVSFLKVGSSPLYYIPGQEEQLLRYVPGMNEKDQRTIELLKTSSVLRDTDQEPLTRVSLRNIKDFAKQLNVEHDGTSEVFWKWYLLADKEAEIYIGNILEPEKNNTQKQALIAEPATQPAPSQKVRKRKPAQQTLEPIQDPKTKPVVVQEPAAARPIEPPSVMEPKIIKNTQTHQDSHAFATDEFLVLLTTYFAQNNIVILEQFMIKKKTDYEFILQLPSPVGKLTYYCKTKNKKRIAETDLSHAFVQGQLKKLPVLFLSTGELSKGAVALLETLKGLTFKRIDTQNQHAQESQTSTSLASNSAPENHTPGAH